MAIKVARPSALSSQLSGATQEAKRGSLGPEITVRTANLSGADQLTARLGIIIYRKSQRTISLLSRDAPAPSSAEALGSFSLARRPEVGPARLFDLEGPLLLCCSFEPVLRHLGRSFAPSGPVVVLGGRFWGWQSAKRQPPLINSAPAATETFMVDLADWLSSGRPVQPLRKSPNEREDRTEPAIER